MTQPGNASYACVGGSTSSSPSSSEPFYQHAIYKMALLTSNQANMLLRVVM
jgi:hypothetical protein